MTVPGGRFSDPALAPGGVPGGGAVPREAEIARLVASFSGVDFDTLAGWESAMWEARATAVIAAAAPTVTEADLIRAFLAAVPDEAVTDDFTSSHLADLVSELGFRVVERL